MKSETFNGARFGAYFKYDFHQMWRNHVKASIGIGLSGLILYAVAIFLHLVFQGTWQAPSLGARLIVFTLAFTALELYQTRTYGYLTDRRKGSAWLLLPASGFEKWLSMIIMTLIVIPFFFLVASLGIDGLLSVADPTYGQPIISSFSQFVSELQRNLGNANTVYETNWNTGVMLWPSIAGFCVNFLFFLYCGIRFKRFKILWGFVIIFVLSTVITLITGFIFTSGFNTGFVDMDASAAETKIRGFVYWATFVSWFVAAFIAFLVYCRIKTIKH